MSTDPRPSAEMRQVLALAATALSCQLRGDDELAAKAVQAISDQYGGGGVELALRGWADHLIERMPPTSAAARLRLLNVEQGGEADIDGAPAEVAWAARMIMARRALDLDMWDALMAALPRDGDLIGDHVTALLDTVALNVKHLAATR
jgi:hypothetical protein